MSDRRPDAGITDPGYNGGGITDGPRKFKPPTPRKPKPDVDYAETLLKAIDTTVTTRIQQAHLDKTVLCTILESDWTNVDKGEYYVSEGDAKYVAMGEKNAYRTGDRVWVLIPLGDYNNQKTIISRQVGDVGDSFVYISPLENFVRLTEDLIPNTNKGEYGLKTNNFTIVTDEESVVLGIDKNDSIQIAHLDMTDANAVDIEGFSAFGVSAKFKTDLSTSEVVRGNYGLHFVIHSIKEEVIGSESGKQESIDREAVDSVYLQCQDMWGNPYGYDMYFEQSKMFEINDPGMTKITSIDVYFFQTYEENDIHITDPVMEMNGGKFVNINNAMVAVPEENNLFIKDLSLYFGHTADTLGSGVYLYSQNNPNFFVKDDNPEDINDKTLVTKFVYRDSATGKNYVLNSLGNNSVYQQLLESKTLPGEFTVRWYIYNPKTTVNDLRAGSGWEDITDFMSRDTEIKTSLLNEYETYVNGAQITGSKRTQLINKFKENWDIDFTVDSNCIKVNGYGDYRGFYKENTIYTDTQRTFRLNDANAGYEKFKVAYILYDSGLSSDEMPTEVEYAEARAQYQSAKAIFDKIESTEEEKTEAKASMDAAQAVMDTYNEVQKEVRYWSRDLIFSNGDDQTWSSLDALNSLTLEFADGGYNGNYLIYSAAISGQGKLLNSGDARVKRTIKGNFRSYVLDETDLTRSQLIRWYIPKNTSATMISEPDWSDAMFSGYKRNSGGTGYIEANLPIRWKPLNGKIAVPNGTAWDISNAEGFWSNTDIDTSETWDKYYIFEAEIADKNDAELLAGHISISYRIKEYLNQHFTNNKIMCKIVRDGKVYEKSVDLTFGSHGVNGTEYSLIVELGDEYETGRHLVGENVPAWTRSHPYTNYIVLKAQLYDERNVALPANEVSYSWDVDEFNDALTSSNIFGVTHSDSTNEDRLYIINGSNREPNSITGEMWNGAYLTCTATYEGYEYTQDLVVPVRLSEDYIGCVGATQAIYTYANTAPAVSSKDKYQILNTAYSLVKPQTTTCVYDSSTGHPTPAETPVTNATKWYSDLPYLSNIKSGAANKTQNLATLILPPTYYQDMNYRTVVKMTVRKNNTNYYAWIQPILIKLDIYTNSFLNQWDGSLQIDTKANRIASAAVFAGKKNSNNSFTGVIMGELQGESANATETGYGIYGRNNGNHTFGLNTDGTAYLGDSSKAQLLFRVGENKNNNDEWESTIQNQGYTGNKPKGIKLDFLGTTPLQDETDLEAPYIDLVNTNDKSGKDDNNATRSKDNTINRVIMSGNQDHLLEVYAHGEPVLHVGNAEYYLQTADYDEFNRGTKIDLKNGSFKSFSGNGGLILSSVGSNHGQPVNDKQADGNGWVIYSNGNFGVDTEGNIHAKAGTIAKWNINSTSLYTGTLRTTKTEVPSSGDVRLSSSNFASKICDHEGTAWRFTIGPNFGVTSGGKLYASNGEFTGKITATEGHIGGWTIGGSSLSSGHVTLNSSTTSGDHAINIRNSDNTANAFYVTNNGYMYASSGSFGGSLNAATGTFNGTLSAGTVTGSRIEAGTLYVNGNPVSYGELGSFVTGVTGFYCNSGQDQGGRTTSISVGFHLTRRTIYAFGARSNETSDDLTGDTAMIYHGGGSSTPDPGTQ